MSASRKGLKTLLFDTLMALWNVSIKSKETKVLVSFFLLYLGISGLPALMSLSTFSHPSAVSHVESTGGGKYPLRVLPSPAPRNMTAIQAHPTVTPAATSAIAAPTMKTGAVVSTKSHIPVGNQTDIIGAGALFQQAKHPALPRNLPSATPTRVPKMPTPPKSVKVIPTLAPEPKVTVAITPTPQPIPTNVVPVDITPISSQTPVAGQNIVSGGHS